MIGNQTRTINSLLVDNSATGTTRHKNTTIEKMANQIQIKSYCESDRAAWDKFVLDHKDSSFFHLSGYKDVIEQSFGHRPHYMMAVCEDRFRGILPLFEIKSRLFGHALVSIPFASYGGVCATDTYIENMLLKSAVTLGKLMSIDHVEMRNENSIGVLHGGRPEESESQNEFNASKAQDWLIKDLYVTFQKEISSDGESNFNAIPRKQRRMIRQGINAGLISKIAGKEVLRDFYRLYSINKKNLGTPVFPIEYFENIMRMFPQTFILTVWKDKKMVAGVMTFIFRDRLMPYFSGALREFFRYAVNDFMYWELMRYGCEKGYKIFDFGRSKKGTGSYDFKRHWGFIPKDMPYAYYLVTARDMPNVSPVNPKYDAMISIWKKLPLFIANWLGPKIAQNIP